jgi:hypothetical protein
MSPEERIREAIEAFVARARQDLDTQGQSLAAEVGAAVRENRTQAQAELERAIGAERGRREAELDAAKQKSKRDHAVALGRLLATIRELDSAISLRGTLEALAAGARTEAPRTALLLVDGKMLRVFGASGYPAGQGPTEVSVEVDSLLVRAVEGRAPVEVPSESTSVSRPLFLRPGAGQSGRLMPLAVGGNVVAVLYSEGPESHSDGQAEVWIEAIEILVRHAALRLENVTSMRTVEALTK